MTNKITAQVIADSLEPNNNRLTSLIITGPRIVLAEFNTHRMLSRNSASSRAIPFNKMVGNVKDNPFVPIKWIKDHKGMQGSEYITTEDEFYGRIVGTWLKAKELAVEQATNLSNLGVTKQFCNRLLEPFMWHTILCTATEWENFLALRNHEAAEIHIAEMAKAIEEAMNNSVPKRLKPGEWHIPFGDSFDENRVAKAAGFATLGYSGYTKEIEIQTKVKIATARCARVSYLNFEGKDDYEADIKLHDTLLASGHMSPFEHCARAMNELEYKMLKRIDYLDESLNFETEDGDPAWLAVRNGWCGNFKGFIQYRKMIAGENKTYIGLKKHTY